MSGMGVGNDRVINGIDEEEEEEHLPPIDEQIQASVNSDRYRRVWFLPLKTFRAKIIEHFDVLYNQHKLVWPQRISEKVTKYLLNTNCFILNLILLTRMTRILNFSG